jgi:hypothetical protein
MSQFMCYTCEAALLPVVEQALVAKGYTRDVPAGLQRVDGTAVVLLCGTNMVLLVQPPDGALAQIEVWGAGQTAVADIFADLLIELHRGPPHRSVE